MLTFKKVERGYSAADPVGRVGFEIENFGPREWRIAVRRPAADLMGGAAGADVFTRDMRLSFQWFPTLRAAKSAAEAYLEGES